jgi:hypothetical protein
MYLVTIAKLRIRLTASAGWLSRLKLSTVKLLKIKKIPKQRELLSGDQSKHLQKLYNEKGEIAN